jgi:proteasome assembly chaperone (PAC2) family protein
VTNLVGYLIDQAALSGLLKALYDLRILILSVENLDEKLKNTDKTPV